MLSRETIKRLAVLNGTKGLQPSEVVDSIFDGEYTKIQLYNSGDSMVMYLHFVEDLEHHRLRYTYNLERKVVKIEQKVGIEAYKTIWDRKEVAKAIIELDDSEQLT